MNGRGGGGGAVLIMLHELANRILHHYTHVQGNNQSIYKQQNKPRKAGEDASVSAQPRKQQSDKQTDPQPFGLIASRRPQMIVPLK